MLVHDPAGWRRERMPTLPDLEILAASSGKSCGCVKVPDLTAATSVGRDGSLIVPGRGAIGSGCSYDLYTKLLR